MKYFCSLILLVFVALFPATCPAQSWSIWGTTPVFDGGRVMPLDTFSRQVVREICGSDRPFIVRDDSILSQLNRMAEPRPATTEEEQETAAPFLVPGTDVFGDTSARFTEPARPDTEETARVPAGVAIITREEASRISQRIMALVPQHGRYFEADELVLSWLGEPEIWDYIPIFSVPEQDFRTEILGVPLRNDIRIALRRVAVFQLENGEKFQRRLADVARRQRQRTDSVDIPYDRIAERLAQAMATYKELTFHPARQRPTRLLELLGSTMNTTSGRAASFVSTFESWAYLLSIGEGPEWQNVHPPRAAADGEDQSSLSAEPTIHPTTARWHDVADTIQKLYDGFARGPEQDEAIDLAEMERLFENILESIDVNLSGSERLMAQFYPGIWANDSTADPLLPLLDANDAQNHESAKRIVLNYYYSIKKLRREIEAAYLALYDNGRSLRVVPVGSELTLGGTENSVAGTQPWGTLQMLLYGGKSFGQRFVDTEFYLDTNNPLQTAQGPIGHVRTAFQSLTGTYTSLTQEHAHDRFNAAARDLQNALRNTATRATALRLANVDDEHPATQEYLAKTAYPGENRLRAEYRYTHFAPFFWMWVFAACSLAVGVTSIAVGLLQKRTSREKNEHKNQKNIRFWAEFLLWGSVAFLVLSIVVTFIGGVQRACITGWAPVTNMYETVVFMAFSASLFGLWYALYPLIHPPLFMAWYYSAFPLMFPLLKRPVTLLTEQNQATPDSPPNVENPKQKRAQAWQTGLLVPRVLLMFVTFFAVIHISYGEYAHEHGVFAAAAQMLKLSDLIDGIVIAASVAVIVWFVPHLVLTALLFPLLLLNPGGIAAELGFVPVSETETKTQAAVNDKRGRREMSAVFNGENSESIVTITDVGQQWLMDARRQITDRTLFVLIAASVALLAGLAAHFNSTQFNPGIRPIAAVLRSNFWLTIHVIAIIVSYAAALVAWGMAAVALGDVIFGRYRYTELPNKKTQIQLPPLNELMAPIIHQLLRWAMLLLILGTVLGARWADYSWGRFWSWDPKEVWALITIMFYAVVLHGRFARFYGDIGVTVGALFGSVAVIFTWYGINFMFKGSVHSYGSGAGGHATVFMVSFIAMNILWGGLALFRYNAVLFGKDDDLEHTP